MSAYKVSFLETGEFALDGGAMFVVVPKTLWGKKIPVDDKNRIDMRLRCILLQGDGKNILIDAGMGIKWDPKLTEIYRLDHSRYNLEKALSEKGLIPEKITDVILTHLHFDHAGGATTFDKNKNVIPTFSNATYYVQKQNLAWAKSPTEKDRASYLKENWEPLEKAGCLKILDGTGEILPGIEVSLFHGHTQGIQLPIIRNGKETFFFCGDVIPTSCHLSIPWVMAYDNFPLMTMKEKKIILDQAVKEKWILVFEHCPRIPATIPIQTEKGVIPGETVSI